jgi:sialate O-acetylesterase
MRLLNSRFLRVLSVLLLLSATNALADVKPSAIFSDNMVLQRGVRVPIWGTADPGEQVRVTLGNAQATTTADDQGKWKALIGPLQAGGPFEMTVAGKNELKIQNVLVGEVWLCSGQSNMEMAVGNSRRAWGGVQNAAEEIAAGNFPIIRQFKVEKSVSGKPQADAQGQWLVATPETVGEFSAVAYFFGRALFKALNVPVGLIHSSWGGTPAESWASAPALLADSELAPMVRDWQKKIADYPEALADYEKKLDDWNSASQQAEAAGKAPPSPPRFPADPRSNSWRPSGLYNAMIAPLIPFAIRGAIWYQGESNADRAYQYRNLFPTMIRDWRNTWGGGDFPFLFVQLASYIQEYSPQNTWAELREAQTMTLSLLNTGMAVAADIGNPYDIHPKNKQEVGRRLALAAQAIAYGKKLVYSGPMYKSMAVEGGKIRLRFTQVGTGLKAQGPLVGFEIAGEDRKFHSAEARIDGEAVIVRSGEVSRPVAVRYAWADNPTCSLYNKEGLPASPFRTDDWPGVTQGAH